MPIRVRMSVIAVAIIGATVLLAGCGGGGGSNSTSLERRTVPSRHQLPGGIVGVMFDGPVLGAGGADVNLSQQLSDAVASGVESLRVSVDWSQAQPYPSLAAVPSEQRSQFTDVGGVPTRFAQLDRIVGAAASRGLTVLPVVERTPRWDALQPSNPSSSPRSDAPYAAYLTALVKRYGSNGTFWTTHPSIPATPIRMWQIWNEPNFTSYWSVQPFARSYAQLLRAAHDAIKASDPNAKVVMAGFADFSWQYVAQVYAVPGAKSLFDVVAVHPYTAQPTGVIVILRRVRDAMDRAGDSQKPILATEITWPSSEGKAPPQFGVGTTEAQQAQRLNQVVPLLIRDRARLNLMGFYWYTWMGDESPSATPYAFDYAGLLKYVSGTITAKPALTVFKRWALQIEHCRRKRSTAEACA